MTEKDSVEFLNFPSSIQEFSEYGLTKIRKCAYRKRTRQAEKKPRLLTCFADETASKCCGIDWVFPEAAAAATASAGLSKEDKFPPEKDVPILIGYSYIRKA